MFCPACGKHVDENDAFRAGRDRRNVSLPSVSVNTENHVVSFRRPRGTTHGVML